MAQGRGANFACDWWAIGILLYEMLARFTPFKAANKMAIYRRILTEPLRFPADFPSRSGRALIREFLQKDPTMRMGCTSEGVAAVKRHEFFDGVDWDACAQRKLTPPWKPSYANEEDTRYFLTDGQDFSQPTLTVKELGIMDDELSVFEEF